MDLKTLSLMDEKVRSYYRHILDSCERETVSTLLLCEGDGKKNKLENEWLTCNDSLFLAFKASLESLRASPYFNSSKQTSASSRIFHEGSSCADKTETAKQTKNEDKNNLNFMMPKVPLQKLCLHRFHLQFLLLRLF